MSCNGLQKRKNKPCLHKKTLSALSCAFYFSFEQNLQIIFQPNSLLNVLSESRSFSIFSLSYSIYKKTFPDVLGPRSVKTSMPLRPQEGVIRQVDCHTPVSTCHIEFSHQHATTMSHKGVNRSILNCERGLRDPIIHAMPLRK